MIIKRLRHEVRVYTKKAPWQKRDNGLTARIIVSFAILTILYLVFLSVLAYVGLGAIPIAVIAGIMILAQWYFSDKIVLWSTGAKIVSREQFPELHDLVERIVARNNLPKPRIAVINTKMPNAFATGKTPKSSIVTVTTGLMDQLETEELEGVIAHELSHIKNRDVLVLTLASLFSTIAWYLMQSSLYGNVWRLWKAQGRRRRNVTCIACCDHHLVCQFSYDKSDISVSRVCGRQGWRAHDRQTEQAGKRPSQDKRHHEADTYAGSEADGRYERFLYHPGALRQLVCKLVLDSSSG